MLPGVGEGFLVAVLRHYGMRTEPAVNAILEGSLPPFLDDLPRDLAKPPSYTQPTKPTKQTSSHSDSSAPGTGGGSDTRRTACWTTRGGLSRPRRPEYKQW